MTVELITYNPAPHVHTAVKVPALLLIDAVYPLLQVQFDPVAVAFAAVQVAVETHIHKLEAVNEKYVFEQTQAPLVAVALAGQQ